MRGVGWLLHQSSTAYLRSGVRPSGLDRAASPWYLVTPPQVSPREAIPVLYLTQFTGLSAFGTTGAGCVLVGVHIPAPLTAPSRQSGLLCSVRHKCSRVAGLGANPGRALVEPSGVSCRCTVAACSQVGVVQGGSTAAPHRRAKGLGPVPLPDSRLTPAGLCIFGFTGRGLHRRGHQRLWRIGQPLGYTGCTRAFARFPSRCRDGHGCCGGVRHSKGDGA